MAVFEKEDVEATAIGKLTPERRLQLSYNGETVADIDMEFPVQPMRKQKIATIEKTTFTEPEFPEPANLTETLLQLLAAPNIASKESVIRTYDHEVKGNTTLKPLQGEYAGPNDAAVLKPLDDSWKGLVNFVRHEPKLWQNRCLLDGSFSHRRGNPKQHCSGRTEESRCWTISLGATLRNQNA